jgi:hypothetical protein
LNCFQNIFSKTTHSVIRLHNTKKVDKNISLSSDDK